jgi:hypothetical protein
MLHGNNPHISSNRAVAASKDQAGHVRDNRAIISECGEEIDY